MKNQLLKFFSKKLYVVTAHSVYIADEPHLVAVLSKKKYAIHCADDYTAYRGGRYTCTVEMCFLDYFNKDECLDEKQVYKTINH